jgi:hypothetical protein
MSFQRENMHRSVFIGGILPFLVPGDRRVVGRVCARWRAWVGAAVARAEARAAAGGPRVPLSDDQVDAVTAALRRMRLPWSGATQTYVRDHLRRIPCLRSDGSDLDGLTEYLGRLYQRAVLAPKTNIGTLDTTRVIERLTQAKLSSFHTTGAASIQQATNLETLLHPVQSTRHPQMVIHLNPAVVDTSDARRVLDHVRGRVIASTFADFVDGHRIVDGALTFALRPDAMVWHNRSVWDLLPVLRDHNPDVDLAARCDGGTMCVEARMRADRLPFAERPERWTTPLPSATTLLAENWPSIADVFCAESSSVHMALRLPAINKKSGEELLYWARLNDDMEVDEEREGTEGQELRESRRQHRSRSSHAAAVPARKRRRGVRRWAISVDATHQSGGGGGGGGIVDPSPSVGDAASSGGGGVAVGGGSVDGGASQAGGANPPFILNSLVEWLIRSLCHVSAQEEAAAEDSTAAAARAAAAAEEPWRVWASLPVEELVLRATTGDGDAGGVAPLSMLRSLIRQTFFIVQEYSAQTARNDELQKYYNAVVWYLKPRGVSLAYLRHLLTPQMLSTPTGGIPRVQQMALHHDAARAEFYLSTEGSNFLGLLTTRNGLAIDRRRCLTTNTVELLSVLGLEALCELFGNGSLSSSLGVNNASVRLVVDHLASRGNWRGVNRTSILVPHAVIASATIEDPIKHFKNASFTAAQDHLQGSSASVLTGCPITFGTNGFDLLLQTEPIIRPTGTY